MLIGISNTDNRMSLIGEAASIIEIALDELFVTWAKPIYVFPRPSSVERKLVGRSTYYWSVLFM